MRSRVGETLALRGSSPTADLTPSIADSDFSSTPQRISRGLVGPDQLVELQLQGASIAALGILDDEDHQERHDRRAGIDDELPRIGPAEERAGHCPQDDYQERQRECGRPTNLVLGPARKFGKRGGFQRSVILGMPHIQLFTRHFANHNRSLRCRFVRQTSSTRFWFLLLRTTRQISFSRSNQTPSAAAGAGFARNAARRVLLAVGKGC
jgi:hypothetical protein